MNPRGTTGGFFRARNQRYQLPSLRSEHGELTNTEDGLKSEERSPYHSLLLAVLSHSKLVPIVSPAPSPPVLCKPRNTVKPPPSVLLAPLATTVSPGEVRGHHVPLDVGFSYRYLSWISATGFRAGLKQDQELLQRAPPDGNAFGSRHAPRCAVSAWARV